MRHGDHQLGVLYYAFPVLAPSIAADTGWSVSSVTAAFSTGLVVSALVGIPVGRWLDRWGPRLVMTAGSVLAVPCVVGVATAGTLPWFFASWVLAGVAMSAVLYQPAFAALARWWGPRRVTALTTLTLLAGLASTIFAPLTAVLVEASDWRRTYLVLAVVVAVVTIPLHLFGLRGTWPHVEQGDIRQDPSEVARGRPFVMLVLAVALVSFAQLAVIVNQVPLLIERGLSTTTAAWALGLGGLGQVLGRLGYGRLTRATGERAAGRRPMISCSSRTGPCREAQQQVCRYACRSARTAATPGEALASGLLSRQTMFTAFDHDGVVWADGSREQVDTVVLATGYRPDLGYLRPLGALADGLPLHVGGISTTHPGLAYVGLEFQRSFSSNTLRGVGRDATHVVSPLAAHVRGAHRLVG